jgi:16S rRNA C967 or C1407 C5-methylase (RsmB/RsmF family)/NOL1/NOP2/fmu family ribosome biogenesis protein
LNLPQSFLSRIKSQLAGESDLFLESFEKEPPVSIRINPEKKIIYGDEKVSWCSTGLYLGERPSFTLDPFFHAGCYYVQDASSMFLEQVFHQLKLSEKKLLILDACAAPGGKSTHLASLMQKGSLLISNEVISSRIPVLNENIIKWGNPDVIITNNDPSAFTPLENLFDVILVDAPCSGEGLFRKDPSALEEWSEVNCDINAARQKRILASLLPALKPDGILIYSTCTFNNAENEQNIKWLVESNHMESISLFINEEWGIKTIKDSGNIGYAFHPHRAKGEGLFISVLRKKSETFTALKLKTKSAKFSALQKKSADLDSWINNQEFSLIQKDEMIFAAREEWLPLIQFLSENLRITHTGCNIAELKGKAIPSHELAMSTLMNNNNFPSAELSTEQALKFLRKEDFKIDLKQKGYTLVTYEGHPLGWINFLGNRFNNYYPVNWRIRMKAL